ncbi:NADPH-dependent FMN reductase [Propioniciclava sp. MC1683]|nr:NAD(P)H-dependent oxidoreductase [Propioniciclava sp. MC1683]
MKVGIVLGSVRDGRAGEAVANWVAKGAAGREATYELIDLKAFDVPLLTTNTHPMRAKKSYDDERVQAWSDAIDACDAYIFVTPEYNHGVPGALKNAVDSLGQE